AYSASEKLVCFFIVVGPLRELPSATSSATSAMTAEPDKSAFPERMDYFLDILFCERTVLVVNRVG
ncbi:hypothetical protein, partial [Ralstonia pseudosolanacearum]|uniref:hypothetical protein n=1 Tax=Ralstonia pseudosolanacearum TaxID=1310165 RepID=UPI002003D8CF